MNQIRIETSEIAECIHLLDLSEETEITTVYGKDDNAMATASLFSAAAELLDLVKEGFHLIPAASVHRANWVRRAAWVMTKAEGRHHV